MISNELLNLQKINILKTNNSVFECSEFEPNQDRLTQKYHNLSN